MDFSALQLSTRIPIIFSGAQPVDYLFGEVRKWTSPITQVYWIRREKLTRLPKDHAQFKGDLWRLSRISFVYGTEILKLAIDLLANEGLMRCCTRIVLDCGDSDLPHVSALCAAVASLKNWANMDPNRFCVICLPESVLDKKEDWLLSLSLYTSDFLKVDQEGKVSYLLESREKTEKGQVKEEPKSQP